MAQEAIPAHRMEKNTRTEKCKIRLIPADTFGEAPPLLAISVPKAKATDRFAIFADKRRDQTELKLVFENQRKDFAPISPASASTIIRRNLWKTLEKAHKSGSPFYLTARHADGTYSSARYDKVDPKGLVSLLESQCEFYSAALSTQTPEKRRKREKDLRLTSDQMRHIRWYLSASIGKKTFKPTTSSQLTSTDRNYLKQYAKARSLDPSGYLDEDLASRLLRERFSPISPRDSSRVSYRRFKQWETYSDGKHCVFSTVATNWSGLSFYSKPELYFSAERNVSGNSMHFNMVRPNPFNTSRSVRASVGGRSIKLQFKNNRVLPARDGTGVSDAIMKAIKAGSEVTFFGTSSETGRAANVTFSASGFTAAFAHIRSRCRRPKLTDWLR